MHATAHTASQSTAATTAPAAAAQSRIPAIEVCRAYLAAEATGARVLNQDLRVDIDSEQPPAPAAPATYTRTGRFDRPRVEAHPLTLRATTSRPAARGAVQTI